VAEKAPFQSSMLDALARTLAETKLEGDSLEEELARVPRWRFVRKKNLERDLMTARRRERDYVEQLGGQPTRRS
jgi:uncharacterized coiled-coil protein SlyX